MLANDYPSSVNFLLFLGDTNLIMSQRLAEWCGKGPALELDIALTNIALDYLGQSRMYYQQAAQEIGAEATEDSLAYFRDAHQFLNFQWVELPNDHWGQTILKIFVLASWQKALYQHITQSDLLPNEHFLKIVAHKAIKEANYHVQWSSQWVLRLANGTDESFAKMQQAVNNLWPYIGEFNLWPTYAPEAIDSQTIYITFTEALNSILNQTTLNFPTKRIFNVEGIHGIHTEHLSYILAELQVIQRNHPNLVW